MSFQHLVWYFSYYGVLSILSAFYLSILSVHYCKWQTTMLSCFYMIETLAVSSTAKWGMIKVFWLDLTWQVTGPVIHIYYIQCPLTNAQSHLWVNVLVDVDVADSLTVAQDGDVKAVGLDLLHQLLGAPRDHQVNVLMHVQQVSDVLTTTDLKQGGSRDVCKVDRCKG